jgi:hypothetical protein
MKTAQSWHLASNDVDSFISEISESKLAAHQAKNAEDRRRAYAEKAERIAEAMRQLDPKCLYLNYQVHINGYLHILVTLFGNQRIRSFHIPFHKLPVRARTIAIQRIGGPHEFFRSDRMTMH